MRILDPALPRIGTDFMTLRGVMRIVYRTFRGAALRRAVFLLDSAARSKATDKEVCNAWL
jgi:hypothetical protein